MTETTLQHAIQEAIRKRGGLTLKLHGSPYMRAGTPDLLCTLNGVPAMVEVKLPGRVVTLKQRHELKQWEAQGWRAGVAHSVEEALAIITGCLYPSAPPTGAYHSGP